jgi:hypothetical protein
LSLQYYFLISRSRKTCWDDDLQIPDLVNITEAKTHNRYGLSQLIFPKKTIVVEDRAYFDFGLMMQRISAENTFVTRIKTNTLYESKEELDLPDDEEQEKSIGNQTGGRVFLFMHTDDLNRDYELFKKNGVKIIREPSEEEFGKVFVFADLYGNLEDLIESKV